MLTITDLYCGAGGSTAGAVMINNVVATVASNHWDRAIETHSANHPDTDHIQADLSQIDPRLFPTTDLLWASPSCTKHSIAQGRKRQDAQPDLFGEILPEAAAERSRATMWDVVRFSEYHMYRAVIVENVVDVVFWPPFQAWRMAMESIGYVGQMVYLNSMHAQLLGRGAPQSRDRFYAIFTRAGDPRPNVKRVVSPYAVCPDCGPVRAVQSFKRTDRAPWGKYRAQYVYRCPNVSCRNQVIEPTYRPAADIIDWSLTGTRIGERTRPLADKTMARIAAGIQRYWQPMLVPVEGRDGKTAAPVNQPTRTMTTRSETALLVPTGGTWRNEAVAVDQPIATRTTRENDGIAFAPFIAELRGGSSDARCTTEALSTVTASGNHHGLVYAPVTRGDVFHGRWNPTEPRPLITSYYGKGGSTPADEALPTVTTVEHHSLITSGPAPAPPQHIDINDVFFRMLEPREITAAMDFPTDYRMLGTRREQVRLAGNAVTPPAARDLVGLVVETLTGEPATVTT